MGRGRAIQRGTCRSEPAREKRLNNTIIQAARVIVDVHRRNVARSKLAPTGKRVQLRSGRPVGRLALAFDLLAPSRGRAQVLRSGQPGMDAGLAAYGHGWPIAAGPRSRTGARGCRALARHRTSGARALWLLWGFSKVTRRKGGTVSGHYRRNGYSPTPQTELAPSMTCHQ